MGFPDIPTIKATAADRVRNAPNAHRLIFFYALIPGVLSLVLTAISYLLSLQIDDTGGLGGMGLRSMLETVQNMLQIGSYVFAVFWAYGYIRAVLCWTRGQAACDRDLLFGFHRWGPVLRGTLLQALIYTGALILTFQISSMVFSMTPLAEKMYAIVEQMMASPGYMPGEEELLSAMAPFFPFFFGVLALLVLPVFYRLRLMDLALMDMPQMGAFFALRTSLLLTRGNCLKLLKLDLSFWWYYLLELLVSAVYYGDVVLYLAGIDVGVSSEVMLFAACVLGLALQTGLYVWKKNHIMTSYALVYDCLLPRQPEEQTV